MSSTKNKAGNAFRAAHRKATKFGCYDDLTQDDVTYLFTLAGGRCAISGKFSNSLSLDHLLPLSKGGRNSIDNVIVVDLELNCSKGNGSTLEFLRFDPHRAYDIVKLLASRSQRSYEEVYNDLVAHQSDENNAWYRKHIQPLLDKEGA